MFAINQVLFIILVSPSSLLYEFSSVENYKDHDGGKSLSWTETQIRNRILKEKAEYFSFTDSVMIERLNFLFTFQSYRGMEDESGDQFVAYFLPNKETLSKRKEESVGNEPNQDEELVIHKSQHSLIVQPFHFCFMSYSCVYTEWFW